jgi:nucleotide-binding universal stress UspA family protein
MYRNILVPVDGSDTSAGGLLEAIKLAGQADRARLRLVHVVNTAVVAMEYAAAFTAVNDLPQRLREDGEAALKQAEDVVRQNGLQSESVLLGTSTDNTGELIVDQAKEWPADVIVMGTHGRRGLARLVLGSNAEYVLRHTQVPVLLVRNHPKD